MAGTDRSRTPLSGGPAVVLVGPQLPQNIGAAARAMANFGLDDLRIVAPREPFPNDTATSFAAGAVHILEAARVFATVEEAVADLAFVVASTARERGQAKPVDAPEAALAHVRAAMDAGMTAGVMFGRERTGLHNEEVALADRILTFPVNPAFASVNLAQAVLLVGYEWIRGAGAPLPFETPQKSPQANKAELTAFFAHLEQDLDEAGFFHPPTKRTVMTLNLRAIFQRMSLTRQDIRTLHGVVAALAAGPRRKDERRGRTVLTRDGEE